MQLYEARPRKKPPTKPLDRTMFLLMKSVACEKSERRTKLVSAQKAGMWDATSNLAYEITPCSFMYVRVFANNLLLDCAKF